MADLFHDDVPFEFLARVFGHMHHFNKNTFLVLTKRPERMRKFISWFRENWLGRFEGAWPREYQHVWLGVTAENQEQADKRIPILLQIPAAVRFVSVEPMLSEVNLSRYLKWPLCKHWRPDEGGDPKIYGKYHWQKQGLVSPDWIGLDWVICGGESGPGARPMHPDWARSLRDQCQAAGTPFFFKQWGEWACEDFEPYYGYGSDSGKWDEYICRNGEQGSCKISDGDGNWLNWTGNPDDTSCIIRRVGKKKAGRLLDGRTWNEMPENQKW
jgi:protein gp37